MQMEREGGEGTISSSPLMKKLVEGVEDLNLGQQMVSVMLLRFSPVVPFSIRYSIASLLLFLSLPTPAQALTFPFFSSATTCLD